MHDRTEFGKGLLDTAAERNDGDGHPYSFYSRETYDMSDGLINPVAARFIFVVYCCAGDVVVQMIPIYIDVARAYGLGEEIHPLTPKRKSNANSNLA